MSSEDFPENVEVKGQYANEKCRASPRVWHSVFSQPSLRVPFKDKPFVNALRGKEVGQFGTVNLRFLAYGNDEQGRFQTDPLPKLLVRGDIHVERTTPTPEELQRRREFYERMAKLHARKPESRGPFPIAEEMIREDRDR